MSLTCLRDYLSLRGPANPELGRRRRPAVTAVRVRVPARPGRPSRGQRAFYPSNS